MSPTRFVGRVSNLKGYRLSEVLLNLKNLGQGRVVARKLFMDRYPEKSFFRLTRVYVDIDHDQRIWTVNCWGNAVFRNRVLGEVEVPGASKPDWQLVPKHEEEEFCKLTGEHLVNKQVPKYISIPPLLELLEKEQMKKMGEDPSGLKIQRDILDYDGRVDLVDDER